MAFVEAYPKQREGVLVWFPVAIAEFHECRPRSGRLTFECCLSRVLKNPLLRFLTIRRLDKNTRVLPYPTIGAKKLEHEGCSEYELLKDAERVEEILNDEEEVRAFLEDLMSPSKDLGQKPPGRLRPLEIFKPPRVNMREALLKSNIAIVKEILKNLCLDKRVKPSSWTPAYVLLRVDVKTGYVGVLERDREEPSNTYSRLIMRDEILRTLVGL